jgi:hypothetical protein
MKKPTSGVIILRRSHDPKGFAKREEAWTMKSLLTKLSVLLIVVSPLSCIQVESRITVKPDGSGTVEETFLVRREFVQMMQEMGKGTPESGLKAETAPSSPLYDEQKLKAKASEMGEGVSFVSGRKIETEKSDGYSAQYAFKNINTLRVNQDPQESGGRMAGDSARARPKEYMTFAFKEGHPASLVIKAPEMQSETTSEEKISPPEVEEQPEEMPREVKELFEGMHIALVLEVQGSIVETNAAHVNGSKITLMELDFGKLLQDPAALKKLNQAQGQSVETAKNILKEFPGIKVDLNREILVKFQ